MRGRSRSLTSIETGYSKGKILATTYKERVKAHEDNHIFKMLKGNEVAGSFPRGCREAYPQNEIPEPPKVDNKAV